LRANNITTRHPKVKIRIHLDNPLHVGGFNIQGRLEIECSTELKLHIGKIGVEVIGFEEIVDKPNIKRGISTRCNRHIFLVLPTTLQSAETGAAPELSMEPPGPDGMWPAKRGKTFLPFTLSLPETVPSVFSNQFSEIRYIIAGSVEIAFHNRKRNLITHHEAIVYEGIDPNTELPHLLRFPVITECQRQLFLGGKGMIKVQCSLLKQIWPAGNEIPVRIRIRNETRRKISAIKLSLVQCFKAYSSKNLTEPVVSYQTTLASQVCKSKSILIGLDNGVERECTLRLQIPSDARTVRRSRLLDVSYIIQVTLIRTLNSIVIQLPLLIVHQTSLEPPPYVTSGREINHLRSRASADSVFKEIVSEGFPVTSRKYVDDSFELENQPLALNSQKPFVNPPRTPPQYYDNELSEISEVHPKTLKHLSRIEDLVMEEIEDDGCEELNVVQVDESLGLSNIEGDNYLNTDPTNSESYKEVETALESSLRSPVYDASTGSFRIPTLRTRPTSLSRRKSIRTRDGRRRTEDKMDQFNPDRRKNETNPSEVAKPKEPQEAVLKKGNATHLVRSTHPNYGFALRNRLAKSPLKSQETPRVRNRTKEVHSHIVLPPSDDIKNTLYRQEKTRRISRTPNEIQDSIQHMFGTKTQLVFEGELTNEWQ
ncbi:hypothetical protein K7432_012653, partial [Basidiobolus ranarum]